MTWSWSTSTRRVLRLLQPWLTRGRKWKSLGERGEDVAARFLRKKGYRIVGRRIREGKGELDLVAVDHKTVVFVEVKTRSSHRHGHPGEAVEASKQRQIVRLAQKYRKRHRLLDHPVRFDVVSVTWPEKSKRPHLEHVVGAFESPMVD